MRAEFPGSGTGKGHGGGRGASGTPHSVPAISRPPHTPSALLQGSHLGGVQLRGEGHGHPVRCQDTEEDGKCWGGGVFLLHYQSTLAPGQTESCQPGIAPTGLGVLDAQKHWGLGWGFSRLGGGTGCVLLLLRKWVLGQMWEPAGSNGGVSLHGGGPDADLAAQITPPLRGLCFLDRQKDREDGDRGPAAALAPQYCEYDPRGTARSSLWVGSVWLMSAALPLTLPAGSPAVPREGLGCPCPHPVSVKDEPITPWETLPARRVPSLPCRRAPDAQSSPRHGDSLLAAA